MKDPEYSYDDLVKIIKRCENVLITCHGYLKNPVYPEQRKDAIKQIEELISVEGG